MMQEVRSVTGQGPIIGKIDIDWDDSASLRQDMYGM